MPNNTEEKIYAHVESGSYVVVTSTDVSFVYYSRIGDGMERKLGLARFSDRFREVVDDAELEAIRTARPLLEQSGTPATPENVHRMTNGEPSERISGVGIVVEPGEYDTFGNLILHEETKEQVDAGVRSSLQRHKMEEIWQISKIRPIEGRCVLNFYGPPGTGKTRVAKAIAQKLGKKVYQVDYASIISKYVGDTAKHIKSAFADAKILDAVLLWDEADSLFSKRVSSGDEAFATSINQNRNVLMQELDRFDGIVIGTTNFFKNFDEAIIRRISRNIEFMLPTVAMLEELYKVHVPNPALAADVAYKAVAAASKGLSGGDVLNVCINAIEACSQGDDTSTWKLTTAAMLKEVANVRKSKNDHNSKGEKRPVGFGASYSSDEDDLT